jgi:hypothetical protein
MAPSWWAMSGAGVRCFVVDAAEAGHARYFKFPTIRI